MASVGLVVAITALGGCGDETVKAGKAKTEFKDYCDKSLAIETYPEPDIDFDSPDQAKAQTKTFAAQLVPVAEKVLAAAPTEIKNDVSVLVDATKTLTQTGDFEASFESPEVGQAQDKIHAFDLKNCGWAKVDVTAKDYQFTGIPKKVGAGPVSFEFANKGKEPHEFVLFRVNDGVKDSVKDIVGLPEEESQTKITPVGGTFALPEKGDNSVVDLKKGRYGVACFVPVGGGDDGPPHTTKGMYAEFEVT